MIALEKITKILRALSDDVRLQILFVLSKQGGEAFGSECSKKIDLTQPTLSHHFKVLLEAHIIHEEKVGTSKRYSIDYAYLKRLGIDLNTLLIAR